MTFHARTHPPPRVLMIAGAMAVTMLIGPVAPAARPPLR